MKNAGWWYALQTRSRQEKAVTRLLELKNYQTFLPVYRTRHRWADRWKVLDLPLFPGYVLCQFEAAQCASILATPGVVDVVRNGNTPAPADTQEIEALRRVAALNLATEPWPELFIGQRVYISGGPLAGLSGTVMDVHDSFRLVLSVTLLQRSVLVAIERDWVIPGKPMDRALSRANAEFEPRVA